MFRNGRVSFVVAVVGLALVLACGAGCPGRQRKAQVTTLLTNDTDSLAKVVLSSLLPPKDTVDLDDVEHLYVTVTSVSLDYAGTVADEGDGNGDDPTKQDPPADPGDDDGGSKIEVFSGELEIDVLDLTDISEILSTYEAPAGKYTKIRISITNPRLYLAAAPEEEITDIQLTANSRLFLNLKFTLPGGPTLLLLDFNSVDLRAQGNGAYTLTPQLGADLTIESAEAQASGEIIAVDAEAGTITVALEEGEIVVFYGSADIYLATDTDTPTGTAADLVVGVSVEVEGLLDVSGGLTASVIRLVAAPPAP